MRRRDEPEQDARMLARAVALLRATPGSLSFDELCLRLGCAEQAASDPRAVVIANGSARRERRRLQRVLQRAAQQGIVKRDGDRVQLFDLGNG